jgi:hypothetical protein
MKEALLRKVHSSINANLRSLFLALFNEKIKKSGSKNKAMQDLQKLFIDNIHKEIQHYGVGQSN